MSVPWEGQRTSGQVRMWPWLASAIPSPEDSPGKAGRHGLGPFPHSSGAVTAGLLRNSSDHPGFCLRAGTNHSAIQVWVKAKALSVCLCVQMCVHVHPLTSAPLSLLPVSPQCQFIFHITFWNNLPRAPIYLVPAWLRCLRGPPCCLQKEAQIPYKGRTSRLL